MLTLPDVALEKIILQYGLLFGVNCSHVLQQIHTNCNNKDQERLTQYAVTDDGAHFTNQNGRRLL